MFACWQTYRYFNIVSNIVNKKMTKKGFFRIMSRCNRRFGRPRKIVRGPRGTDFPPRAPNLSLCPNDFSLQTTLRPWSVGSTYALTGWTQYSLFFARYSAFLVRYSIFPPWPFLHTLAQRKTCPECNRKVGACSLSPHFVACVREGG